MAFTRLLAKHKARLPDYRFTVGGEFAMGRVSKRVIPPRIVSRPNLLDAPLWMGMFSI
ncbi:hypothetical protein BN2475_410007 [Paraburkholderia ribeironis]|uniref:Uncharacterized protein n=1 Tax=Paraburkholderia ribeironis TaxID=1247936 RepID=A0A1N7S822_9BURK|nr:hypothetical protein BN2475_410007 [Paraburkholderia ribeironis]